MLTRGQGVAEAVGFGCGRGWVGPVAVVDQATQFVWVVESVQLYTCDEFTQLLADGGLQVDRLFGDYCGARYASDQPRMIAVGSAA